MIFGFVLCFSISTDKMMCEYNSQKNIRVMELKCNISIHSQKVDAYSVLEVAKCL